MLLNQLSLGEIKPSYKIIQELPLGAVDICFTRRVHSHDLTMDLFSGQHLSGFCMAMQQLHPQASLCQWLLMPSTI